MGHDGQIFSADCNAELSEICRHLDGTVEVFHGYDTLESDLLIRSFFLNVHYVYCELLEAGETVLVYVSCPAAPDGCKTRTVSDVIEAAEFMLELMRHPVASVVAAASKTVVCEASCPHNFSTCVVIHGIVAKDDCILLNCAQKPFCECIRDLHVAAVCEISFHGMHHDVRAAAGCLIVRKSHRELRVQDGKSRT